MKPKHLSKTVFWALGTLLVLLHIWVSLEIAKHYRGDWDIQVWLTWFGLLRSHGLWATIRQFPSVNYPPVTVVTLFLFQKFISSNPTNLYILRDTYLIKLPILFLDWLTLAGLFVAFYRRISWRFLFVMALVLFNPAVLIISGWWGQWDAALVAPMVASLVLAWKRPMWSGVAFAFALLVKQQAIIFIPVLFIVLVHRWFKDKSKMAAIRLIAGIIVPLAAVFAVLQMKGALWPMLKHTYGNSVGLFTWVTMNAYNIWYNAIGVAPKTNDNLILFAGLSYRNLSILVLGLITLATLWLHWKSKVRDTSIVLTSALVISLAFFVITTEMHERYILFAVFVACLLVYYQWKWLPIAIGLSITASLNMMAVITNIGIKDYAVVIAYANIVLFIWTLILAWRTYRSSAVAAKDGYYLDDESMA